MPIRFAVALAAALCPILVFALENTAIERLDAALTAAIERGEGGPGVREAWRELESGAAADRATLVALDADLARRDLDFARPRVEERLARHDGIVDSLRGAASVLEHARSATEARRAATDFREQLRRLLSTSPAPPKRRDPAALFETDAIASRRRAVRHPIPASFLTPPTDADLAATDDAPDHPELRQLAASLGKDPTALYRHVRSNVLYEPYAGSRKGALLTLWERSGNDVDTASLLVSLLRASGRPARYARAMVSIDAARLRRWVGDVQDTATAAALLTIGRVPLSIAPDGTFAIEHVWVVYYAGGTAGQNGWIALDPSLKDVIVHEPQPVSLPASWNAQQVVNRLRGSGRTNDVLRMVYGVPRTPFAAQAGDPDADREDLAPLFESVTDGVQAAIEARPALTAREVFGYTEVAAEPAAGTALLPVVSNLSYFSSVPDELRHFVTFEVRDETGRVTAASFRASLVRTANRRITISYLAATAADQTIIESYGGALMQTPPIVNVVPVVRLGGDEVARGTPVRLGTAQTRRFTFSFGNRSTTTSNTMAAGDTIALGIDYGRTSASAFSASLRRMEEARKTLLRVDSPAVVAEPILGEMLHAMLQAYFGQADAYREVVARSRSVVWLRVSSGGVAMQRLVFRRGVDGALQTIGSAMGYDVQQDNVVGFSRRGDVEAAREFMSDTGILSSAFEHSTIELVFGPALSTIRILDKALALGVPVFRINAANRALVLPRLGHAASVITEVTNALNAGKEVTIPDRMIGIENWYGTGWIARDPRTGSAAYMISGGMASASDSWEGGTMTREDAQAVAISMAQMKLLQEEALVVSLLLLAAADPEPASKLALGVLALSHILSMAQINYDINRLVSGEQDPYAYIADSLRYAAVDLIAGQFGRKGFQSLADLMKALPGVRQEIANFLQQHYTTLIDHILGGGSNAGHPTATADDDLDIHLYRVVLSDSSYATMSNLAEVKRARGAATLRALLTNEYFFAKNQIGAVAAAIATAPRVNGFAELADAAASSGDFNAAYVLNVAARLKQGTSYSRKDQVTYRPVTGFNAAGQPILGDAVAGELVTDFDLEGSWIFTQHHARVAEDLRLWNLVQKAQAAYAAKLTTATITFWSPAPSSARLTDWARTNAPNVRFVPFPDGFR